MKTMSFRNVLFFLCCWVWGNMSWAQRGVQPDTASAVQLLPLAPLQKLQQDSAYQYPVEKAEEESSLFSRFLMWLSHQIRKATGYLPSNTFEVLYVLVGLLLVWLILKWVGVNMTDVFRKKGQEIEVPYEAIGEDIRVMSFETAIDEAIGRNNFRLAVRLYYLWTLRSLDNKALINWQRNKTNHQYLIELEQTHFFKDFAQLTLDFEYAWYGDFPLNEARFRDIQEAFIDFGKRL
jgi:hypothetical protein